MTKYISTRGAAAPQSFMDAMFAGMAPDGGLYVPDAVPVLDSHIFTHGAGMSYADIAALVMQPFIGGDIKPDVLRALLGNAYESGRFHHSALAPLTQVGPNAWIMELFHGPTLSFKDYALQFLGQAFDHELGKRGQKLTLVGATSGDTGSAAIEACRHCKNIDIFILFPKGRTSETQQRQMTSVDAPNVFSIAVEGNFDDCQAIVKKLFADDKFRQDYNLSAVNSINWARIMAQIVYYVSATIALGAGRRNISFAVPTGNFGNVFAAQMARMMGAPIHELAIGSNRNDILTRFFETGTMKAQDTRASLSPSMDIQISSNFERYLHDLLMRDHELMQTTMDQFAREKSFSVTESVLRRARRDFSAYRSSDEETLDMMGACYKESGILIDPHTAVGLRAAQELLGRDPTTPVVALACAHPAKFPDAVLAATGILPPIPDRLAVVLKRAEHFTVLPKDYEQIRAFIKGQARKA